MVTDNSELVQCPNGCGCKVPKSTVEAVLAKRTATPQDAEAAETLVTNWREFYEVKLSADARLSLQNCITSLLRSREDSDREQAIAYLESIGAETNEERVLLAQFLATRPTVKQIHLATSLVIETRKRGDSVSWDAATCELCDRPVGDDPVCLDCYNTQAGAWEESQRQLTAFQQARPGDRFASGVCGRQPHPEDFCHQCGRANIVWFAPNELWNKAVRAHGLPEILCPVCFVQAVEAADISSGAWRVAPGDYGDAIAAAKDLIETACNRDFASGMNKAIAKVEAIGADWRSGSEQAYSEREVRAEVRLATKADAADEIITALRALVSTESREPSHSDRARAAAEEIHKRCDEESPDIPRDSTSHAPNVEEITAIITRHMGTSGGKDAD